MPYQRALIRYTSKFVFYAVSLNSNPGGKEDKVTMSYLYISQRGTTRRLEQHPRRFRPRWKIKQEQHWPYQKLPKHCSKSPLGGIFHMFMQLQIFTWSEGEGSEGVLSSGGIQSQTKPLPAATGVYGFSLQYELCSIFCLILSDFQMCLEGSPAASFQGVPVLLVLSMSKFILLPFPPQSTHRIWVVFDFPSKVKKRHMLRVLFPL